MLNSTLAEKMAEARAHIAARRPADAERLCRQILQADADNAEALHLLGTACHAVGKLDDAEANLQRAVQLAPSMAEAHHHLGALLAKRGRLDVAVASFAEAARLDPDSVEMAKNLRIAQAARQYSQGLALARLGKPDEAETQYRRALAFEPGFADALSSLGALLVDQQRFAEAIDSFTRVTQLLPESPEAHSNLGLALAKQNQLDAAVACYRRALELKPDQASLHISLAGTFSMQDRLDEAVGSYLRASNWSPTMPRRIIILPCCWSSRIDWPRRPNTTPGRLNCARSCRRPSRPRDRAADDGSLRRRMAGVPMAIEAPVHAGPTRRAALERISPGWPHHFAPQRARRRRHAAIHPVCRASQTTRLQRDRRLLVVFGAAGGHLPRRGFRGHPPPTDAGIRRAYRAAQLARHLRHVTRQHSSTGAICSPDPELVAQWRAELAAEAGLKVGIAWQGSAVHPRDRYRSIPLAQFAGIAAMRGLRLYSLQTGAGREQLADFAHGWPITDLGDRLGDFHDTAAMVANLDLVITCDSAPPTWPRARPAGVGRPGVCRRLAVLDARAQNTPSYPTMHCSDNRAAVIGTAFSERSKTSLQKGCRGRSNNLRTAAPPCFAQQGAALAGIRRMRRG